jgi:hypothetical protein
MKAAGPFVDAPEARPARTGRGLPFSSAVASDFAFVRILGANCEGDPAARRKLRGHECLARSTCFHKIVQNAVRYRFVKRALIPIRSKIELERFAFDAQTVRHVIDVDPGKIGLARYWANRSKIVCFKMNPIITAGRIWKGFEPRLGRRSRNFCFAASEKR